MSPPGSDDRADRLKAALWENLKRRKAQARGRTVSGGPAEGGTDATGAMEKPQSGDAVEPEALKKRPGE